LYANKGKQEMHLTKETFRFLSDLNRNNNREWFGEHKVRYDRAREEVKKLVEQLIVGLSAFDPQITPAIPADKCLFRIYRDIRFRKDKTPYKTWLGAGISVNGRKLDGPEYYIHVQPGNSFIAAGYWRPDKDHLAAIRQEIDYNGAELEKILGDLEQLPHQIRPDRDDMLKRAPAGYDPDHPWIDLLRLKSFTLSRPISDAEWCEPDAISNLLEIFQQMYPFKLFIHQAIGDEGNPGY